MRLLNYLIMLNLKELQTFVKLVEIGNYSKTASALHLSQPTVSVHIKSLESELGIPLLRSVGKFYRPTEDGYIVLHYAQELLKLSNDLVNTFKTDKAKADTLNVATTSIGAYLLPKISDLFNIKFPDTYLMLSINNSSTTLQSLQDSVADAIIVQLTPEQVVDYRQQYQVTPVTKDTLHLVAATNHPLSEHANITIADLQKQTFIMREAGSNTASILTKYLYQHQITPKNLIHVAQHESVYQTIKQGIGIGLLPEFWLNADRENLKILNVPDLPIQRTSYLVTAQKNDKITYFGQLASELFKNTQ